MIAKAWESGGRKRVEGPTLLPLLDAVLGAVALPVVAAGGIATPRGVAAALAAGAGAVRVGTRFIAATESDAHPTWVAAVIDAGAADAVVSDAFNTGLAAGAAPRAAERARGGRGAAGRAGRDAPDGGAEIPVPRFGPQPPTRDSTGAIGAMALYAGQSAGAVRAVMPAAEIVAELATGVPSAETRA